MAYNETPTIEGPIMTVTVQATVGPKDLVKLAITGVAVTAAFRAKRKFERAVDREVAKREVKNNSK